MAPMAMEAKRANGQTLQHELQSLSQLRFQRGLQDELEPSSNASHSASGHHVQYTESVSPRAAAKESCFCRPQAQQQHPRETSPHGGAFCLTRQKQTKRALGTSDAVPAGF